MIEAPGCCGASRLAAGDCGVSGVAEAIGLVPVVAAAPVADDEGVVLEGSDVSAARAAAGPAVEEPAPGAGDRVDGGVVAVAGVAGARCTVVPDVDTGDAVAGVEGDGGVLCRLPVVLLVPAAGVMPCREMAGDRGIRGEQGRPRRNHPRRPR